MRTCLFLALCVGACASPQYGGNPDAPAWRYLCARYDANGDGRIARGEYPRSEHAFQNLDADGDGRVTPLDFAPEFDGRPRGPWRSLDEFVYGEGGPVLGDEAPPFRLESTSAEAFELAAFRGKRPVALVFGSFT